MIKVTFSVPLQRQVRARDCDGITCPTPHDVSSGTAHHGVVGSGNSDRVVTVTKRDTVMTRAGHDPVVAIKQPNRDMRSSKGGGVVSILE